MIDENQLRHDMSHNWISRAELYTLMIKSIIEGKENKQIRLSWRDNSDAISNLLGPYMPITQSQADAHDKTGYPSTSVNENRDTVSIMMKHEAGYAIGWFGATKFGDTGNADKYDYNWHQNIVSLSNFLVHMLNNKDIESSLNGLFVNAKKEMIDIMDGADTKTRLSESAIKVAEAITDAIIKKYGGN